MIGWSIDDARFTAVFLFGGKTSIAHTSAPPMTSNAP
jgi:hypothetical protein